MANQSDEQRSLYPNPLSSAQTEHQQILNVDVQQTEHQQTTTSKNKDARPTRRYTASVHPEWSGKLLKIEPLATITQLRRYLVKKVSSTVTWNSW